MERGVLGDACGPGDVAVDDMGFCATSTRFLNVPRFELMLSVDRRESTDFSDTGGSICVVSGMLGCSARFSRSIVLSRRMRTLSPRLLGVTLPRGLFGLFRSLIGSEASVPRDLGEIRPTGGDRPWRSCLNVEVLRRPSLSPSTPPSSVETENLVLAVLGRPRR